MLKKVKLFLIFFSLMGVFSHGFVFASEFNCSRFFTQLNSDEFMKMALAGLPEGGMSKHEFESMNRAIEKKIENTKLFSSGYISLVSFYDLHATAVFAPMYYEFRLYFDGTIIIESDIKDEPIRKEIANFKVSRKYVKDTRFATLIVVGEENKKDSFTLALALYTKNGIEVLNLKTGAIVFKINYTPDVKNNSKVTPELKGISLGFTETVFYFKEIDRNRRNKKEISKMLHTQAQANAKSWKQLLEFHTLAFLFSIFDVTPYKESEVTTNYFLRKIDPNGNILNSRIDISKEEFLESFPSQYIHYNN